MNYLVLAVVISALLLSGRVFADPRDSVDPDYAVELVKQGLIVSFDQLLARHQVLARNRVLDLELEQTDGVFTYEVLVFHWDGHINVYVFDAVTGELLSND
ncbi:PepSY domain-containing protein [Amphritea sp.]|uniref:PepSY domain-containing protein n=1 Tax=Amphritea sp. TaxID=1872502 RepID=UPI003D14C899